MNMISHAGVCGVLDKLLLANGSAEEDPLSLMYRPRRIGGKLFRRTTSSLHLAADHRQRDGVIGAHHSQPEFLPKLPGLFVNYAAGLTG